MSKKKQYLILEEGPYSDYSVSFLEVLPEWTISEQEILDMLNSSFADYQIAGHIHGEIETTMQILDFEKEAAYRVNRLFSCFEHRPVPSLLDRWYSKEECLAVAIKNSPGDEEYWHRSIDFRYEQYQKAYALYRKFMGMSEV